MEENLVRLAIKSGNMYEQALKIIKMQQETGYASNKLWWGGILIKTKYETVRKVSRDRKQWILIRSRDRLGILGQSETKNQEGNR